MSKFIIQILKKHKTTGEVYSNRFECNNSTLTVKDLYNIECAINEHTELRAHVDIVENDVEKTGE